MRLLSKNKLSIDLGFTLVEVTVIIPIAIIVVVGLIAIMVSAVGDTLVSNASIDMTYATRDAAERIERDTRISSGFLATYGGASISPQGKDDASGQFSSNSGDLILYQPATTASPYTPDRGLIFFKDQPNDCASPDVIQNNVLMGNIIYFLKSDGDTSTLWRRTVLDDFNQNTPADSHTVCDTPWQRNSCSTGVTGARCEAKDEKIIENVSDFTVTYLKTDNSETTNPSEADSINIQIATDKKVAGENIHKVVTLRIYKLSAEN